MLRKYEKKVERETRGANESKKEESSKGSLDRLKQKL